MQVIQCFNEPSRSTDAGALFAASHAAQRWLPFAVFGVAVAAIVLLGTPVKNQVEVKWLHRLAAGGDTGAEVQLGTAYRDGRYGLAPSQETAFYWFKQAADRGDIYAEELVADAYAHGRGTQPDPALAVQWWRKAVDSGDANARVHLGEAMIAAGRLADAEKLLKKKSGISLMPPVQAVPVAGGV